MIDKILKLLHKDERQDPLIVSISTAFATWLNKIDEKISEFYANFFFDTLSLRGCTYFEKLLNITPDLNQSIESRRAVIQAKWLSNCHNSLKLIQDICNTFKENIIASFIDGVIGLEFENCPPYLKKILQMINEVKPAHIPLKVSSVMKDTLNINVSIIKVQKKLVIGDD